MAQEATGQRGPIPFVAIHEPILDGEKSQNTDAAD